MAYDDREIELPFGFLMDNCNDWGSFCRDTGLNPWVLKEGRATAEDTYSVSIKLLKKHGILTSREREI